MTSTYTKVTRKGQITLPAAIRRSLGIQVGDRIVISLLATAEGEEPQVVLKPVRSVAQATFGVVPPLKQPRSLEELRGEFEDGTAAQVMAATAANS